MDTCCVLFLSHGRGDSWEMLMLAESVACHDISGVLTFCDLHDSPSPQAAGAIGAITSHIPAPRSAGAERLRATRRGGAAGHHPPGDTRPHQLIGSRCRPGTGRGRSAVAGCRRADRRPLLSFRAGRSDCEVGLRAATAIRTTRTSDPTSRAEDWAQCEGSHVGHRHVQGPG